MTLSLSAGPARAETAPAAQPAARAAPAESSPAPRPRRIGLLVGGLATWGASYAMSVMAALASLRSSNGVMCGGSGSANPPCVAGPGNTESRDLLIPVVGPWMAISPAPSKDTALLAFLGIAQATGVALTVAGIVRYSADGAAAGESRDVSGPHQRASRPGGLLSFGVLPARDGAFGFLSGRM